MLFNPDLFLQSCLFAVSVLEMPAPPHLHVVSSSPGLGASLPSAQHPLHCRLFPSCRFAQ